MPGLCDLHRHLDGSLRPDTAAALAGSLGEPDPGDLRFVPGMGLDAALACFARTLALLQQPGAVRRVAAEICEDAAAEGVSCLEIRFAPQLHRGAPLAAIVDAALAGIDGRAGLVLCALYGEDPAVAGALVDLARGRPGVVGLDLAGGPRPGDRDPMGPFEGAFRRAEALGLGRTVHAGEGRPAAEIGVAIRRLRAQRIGHGTTLLQDPEILDLVLKEGVTIEACISSNVHVGAIPSIYHHPLPRWLRLGVRACVNTDNTLLSAVDASEEHRRAATLPGMDAALLAQAVAFGHAAAFGEPRPPPVLECGPGTEPA